MKRSRMSRSVKKVNKNRLRKLGEWKEVDVNVWENQLTGNTKKMYESNGKWFIEHVGQDAVQKFDTYQEAWKYLSGYMGSGEYL